MDKVLKTIGIVVVIYSLIALTVGLFTPILVAVLILSSLIYSVIRVIAGLVRVFTD